MTDLSTEPEPSPGVHCAVCMSVKVILRFESALTCGERIEYGKTYGVLMCPVCDSIPFRPATWQKPTAKEEA